MSEDAPVNSGAVKWPHPDSAYFTVRSMQVKLHRWAGEDSSRRFGDLFNLVYDPAFLVQAWERVSGNKGARTPGVDKATVAMIETWVGVEEFLGQIRDSLKSGGFRPAEVRQVTIPKGTSGKFRKLGIPTVADRVVQASLKAVLEPIFEADFKPCSYGFRPNRRAQDAIAEIHHYGTSGYRWVLECDIKACFDEIDHTALMDRLRARIKDKRVCALVKAFLKSGVLTGLGDREETLTGTPQGGILSPLLANIALSALDDHFDRQWHQEMGSDGQRRKRRRDVSIRKCCEKAFRWPAWRSSSAAPVMALRVRVLPGRGWLGPGAEVFGAGLPGQEAFQRLPAERLAAVPPAFVEVGGQVGEQVQRGHPGGRGDGPDHGGVPGGVPVMGAAGVLPGHDRPAELPLGSIVVVIPISG